ncbi:MAG: hypothetical protein HYV63_05505 [Candidatus Schekmanbacteria bacterium]|nr:hypothetical protein [Candidatus Schekmanbacteria bacterium]
MRSSLLLSLSCLAAATLLLACSEDGSPAAPQDPRPSLVNSDVLVDGVSVAGMTVSHENGESTMFRAHVTDPRGLGQIRAVYVRYNRPMGMHGRQGVVELHDDGHGCDGVAGDGDFCHEDHGEGAGCHGDGAASGDYDYDFWCEDQDGHDSNHQHHTVHMQ